MATKGFAVAGYRKSNHAHGSAEAAWAVPSHFPRASVFQAGSGFLGGSRSAGPVTESSVEKFSAVLKHLLPESLFLSTGGERRGSMNHLGTVLCRKPHIVPVNCCPFSFSAGILLSQILR